MEGKQHRNSKWGIDSLMSHSLLVWPSIKPPHSQEACGIFSTVHSNLTASREHTDTPDPQHATGGTFVPSRQETSRKLSSSTSPIFTLSSGMPQRPLWRYLQLCALPRGQAVWDKTLTVVHESKGPKTEPFCTPGGARNERNQGRALLMHH